MGQHRTRPPRAGAWEHSVLRANQPETWMIDGILPEIRNKIPWRLQGSLLTARIIRLVRSTLAELDLGNKDEWQCHRYLGSGAFGAAVLFTRNDEAGNLVDEIVVKEMAILGSTKVTRTLVPEARNRYIANEALIHSLLSGQRSDNLIHLRGYKAIFPNLPPSDHAAFVPSSYSRFYLEFAPYNNLGNLLAKYKAFNRYLPELFLWHLFNSLAKAILILEQNHPDFVVHFDIKPENIFLGYEARKSLDPRLTGGLDGEEVSYPSIKLGDFGLSLKCPVNQPQSMWQVGQRGTFDYHAPEIVRSQDGPYGPLNRPDDKITPRNNVWGIGRVMYDAFSLSGFSHFDYFRARGSLQYQTMGEKLILDYDTTPFEFDWLHRSSPYTRELSDLIERCMHADPLRRPTAAQVCEETTRIMRARYADPETGATPPYSVRRRKLYYRGNEINDMPFNERNCGKTIGPDEYFDLLHPGHNDPEDRPLNVYSEQIWETQLTEEDRRSRKSFYGHWRASRADDFKFLRHILQNTKRLGLKPRPGSIDLLDGLDLELTYHGTADDDVFINESKRDYGRPPKYYNTDDTDDSSDDDSGNENNNKTRQPLNNRSRQPSRHSRIRYNQAQRMKPSSLAFWNSRMNSPALQDRDWTNDPLPDSQLQDQVQREMARGSRQKRPTASSFFNSTEARRSESSETLMVSPVLRDRVVGHWSRGKGSGGSDGHGEGGGDEGGDENGGGQGGDRNSNTRKRPRSFPHNEQDGPGKRLRWERKSLQVPTEVLQVRGMAGARQLDGLEDWRRRRFRQ